MMGTMQQSINGFFYYLRSHGFNFDVIDLLTVGVSLILFFAATPICRWLNNDDNLSARASMMRALNFLIILAVLANGMILQRPMADQDTTQALAAGFTQSLIVIYFAALTTQIINYFVRRRFGRTRTNKDKATVSDTYSSRGLSLFVAFVMSIIAIVSCLRIMGLDQLLEAGGAIGIIGIVLAMTQAAWAPDIISGLIILNSRFCEDGEVIQFNMDGKEVIASIFKTKLFHTEVLDLANNHRIMVRNAKLRDFGVQNLSRFASARGLRERLLFNIDYRHSEAEVSEMIKRAFVNIDKSESAREEQYEPEIRVHKTGNYAVTWAIYYYIKDVKKVLTIRQTFRSYILAESNRSGIALATPILQDSNVRVHNQQSLNKIFTDKLQYTKQEAK
ncbi:MAG: small-conductance mechanosensitive channel [Arenicella sp.]|jgi:small-conductance mechanosensitive channel